MVAHACMLASVGIEAIQLAKLSGFTVIATASFKNHAYLKSLGADHVFSYSDPNTPGEIKKLTKGGLNLGFDAISENGTTQLVIDSFGDDVTIPKGAKKQVLNLGYVRHEDLDASKKEQNESVELKFIVAYTLLGKKVRVAGVDLPASEEDKQFSVRSFELLERLLGAGKLRHQNVKVFGGLEMVRDGFEYMKEGKNSAEKIVYHPQETRL